MNRRLATKTVLVASLAGMFAALPPSAVSGEGQETVHCYGVNKCQGTGDCGGKGHSCAGQNSCKRQGFIEMDKSTCLRLDGGRLTPEPEGEAKAEEAPKK